MTMRPSRAERTVRVKIGSENSRAFLPFAAWDSDIVDSLVEALPSAIPFFSRNPAGVWKKII
jgi:hypothetical protein